MRIPLCLLPSYNINVSNCLLQLASLTSTPLWGWLRSACVCIEGQGHPPSTCRAGDLFSKRWVDTGRIMAAQLSVCFTFPTTIALLRWLPVDPPGGMASVKVLYGCFLFFMGSTISWCAPQPPTLAGCACICSCFAIRGLGRTDSARAPLPVVVSSEMAR